MAWTEKPWVIMTTIHDVIMASPVPEKKSNQGPPAGRLAAMDSMPPKTSEELRRAARMPP